MNALTGLCSWIYPASGEVPSARPQITPEEAKRVLPYAFSAPAIHMNTWSTWLEPSGYRHISPASLTLPVLPGQIEAREACFFDPQTALKVALFQKGNELMLVFGALNSSYTEVDPASRNAYMRKLLGAGGYNLVWGRPLVFQRALELVDMLKNLPHFQNLELRLAGQSFGGGIASYVALKLDCPAICFNSLPIGSWVSRDVGPAGIQLADRNIKQVSVEGDWLSDNFLMRYRDWVSAMISLPSLPGKRVFVPTAYASLNETHAYVVGSLLVYTGFDRCAQPAGIVQML